MVDLKCDGSSQTVEKVLDWMAMEPRPPADTVFESGAILKLARAIEGEVSSYLAVQKQVQNDRRNAAWLPGPWPGWEQLREDLKGPHNDDWLRGPDGMVIHCSSRGLGNRGWREQPSTRPWWGRKGNLELRDKAGRTRVFGSAERVKALLEAL